MLKTYKPVLPGLVVVVLAGLYTLFWFTMASRIEKEIERWVERQAEHGTQVSYQNLDISGYPFRLVATFEAPQIIAEDHESGFAWAGGQLRIVTQAYDINHIIIDLFGHQSVSWIDTPQGSGRSASRVTIDFEGEKLRGSLLLKSGRIESIDTDFRGVSADIFADGAITLLPSPPDHLDIALLEYHSREVKEKREGQKFSTRDVMLVAKDIVGLDAPLDEMKPGIDEVMIAFSEDIAGAAALHSGDIGTGSPQIPAQKVKIHDAHILWAPLSVRLNGDLKRGRKKNADFSGKIHLYLKGHDDVVRQMAKDGDMAPVAAIVAGGLFGILSMVSETNEDGELVIPLKVKDGDVSFGFLPLFSKEDYE